MSASTAMILAVLLIAAAVVVYLLFRALQHSQAREALLQAKAADLESRYAPIINMDEAVELQRTALERLHQATKSEEAGWGTKRAELSENYSKAKALYDKLKREVSLLEENLEDISFGVYKPHYDFESSDDYKRALESVWEQKKAMLKEGKAAICSTNWSVGGSERDGARMAKSQIKLMLRAFNGEADAAIAKVTWNNATRMEERISKAAQAVNDAGAHLNITVQLPYVKLALAELRLTHEYAARKREEQEEQREIREQMREEERAQREYEKAEKDANTEKERYERALAKARAEVETATGAAAETAALKMRDLEQKLAEAEAKAARAISMAQQTKSGHVYVISNIGSFGEETFKIGMTRRLEPIERVNELGDASVPFRFDVHAMIYSEDAPKLENMFHRRFHDRRVNLVNMRKEFFRVGLHELEEYANAQGLSVILTKVAEAREHRETMALRTKAAEVSVEREEEFPEALSA